MNTTKSAEISRFLLKVYARFQQVADPLGNIVGYTTIISVRGRHVCIPHINPRTDFVPIKGS